MPDAWSMVAELDAATQERMAAVLETRGAELQQQAIRRAFLSDVPFPAGARVLEVGCGTGVLTRVLAGWPDIGEVVGVDTATSLLQKARTLAADLPNVRFEQADARALPFEADRFDAVVFDSTLSHVPGPDRALAEAARVLGPGGWLAALDGDYATTTVALGDHDPLQACVDATMANSVTDRFLMRRLSALVQATGLEVAGFRSHGYVETAQPGYMLTVVDRGADILRAAGQVDDQAAAALKAEARRRVAGGTFFGHIAYASLIARNASSAATC